MIRFLQCVVLYAFFTLLLALAILCLPATLAWKLYSGKVNTMKQVYFLIFRLKDGDSIPWSRPVGGLVMKPKCICGDIAVSDFGLAEEIASIRYHCAPDEALILAECMEEIDQKKALRLHRRYEREMNDFLELMEVA